MKPKDKKMQFFRTHPRIARKPFFFIYDNLCASVFFHLAVQHEFQADNEKLHQKVFG